MGASSSERVGKALQSVLQSVLRGRVEIDWPLARHTTYQIGGPADLALFPADTDDLAAAIRELRARGVPWVVLGGGSNVLVSDRGVRGAVIVTTELQALEVRGQRLRVGAGVDSHQVAVAARDAGLGGAEFLAWLPGSIGGACLMNARAYGGEISGVLRGSRCVDRGGKVRTLTHEPGDFSYKRSPFQDQRLILAEAEFQLGPGDQDAIDARMREIEARRRGNHEMDHPSCGCVFKNDYSVGVSSGRLIDQCGLKGYSVGAARVSLHHANFVVNLGGATATEVMQVIRHVHRTVAATLGHRLELEVRLLGEWDGEAGD